MCARTPSGFICQASSRTAPGLCLAVLLLTSLNTGAAQAPDRQTDSSILEEITVTAQKRDQNLADVPKSISVLDSEKLADADINDMEELQTYVPNLSISETNLGPRIHIRGMGSGVNQGFEQSVGLYIDGIYYGRSQQSRMQLVDVEQVEVIRGTQSALFGKNSIAGAMSIETAKPADFLQARISGLYGNELNERKLNGYLSGPITDSVNARLSVHARDTDGYIRNLTLQRDEPSRQERLVRGTFHWQATDDLEFVFKAQAGDFKVAGEQSEIIYDAPSLAGPFAGLTYAQILALFGQDSGVLNNFEDGNRSANGDENTSSSNDYVLTFNYQLASGLLLTGVTGYNSYDLDELCDCDYTGGNVFLGALQENHDQFSQEFRIASPEGGPVEWLAGIYYQDNALAYTDRIMFAQDSIMVPVIDGLLGPGAGSLIGGTAPWRDFRQDTEIVSLFGQVTTTLTNTLRLGIGGRLSNEQKMATRSLGLNTIDGSPLPGATAPFTQGIYAGLFNINPHALAGDRETTDFMPSLQLLYDLDNNAMAYLSYNRGVKSGGFDTRSNNAPAAGGSFEFDDEKADTYEAGVKLGLLNGSADLGIAVYLTDYKNLQVSSFDGILGFNVGNAASSRTQGLELDGRWLITNNLQLNGSLAFTDFEYREFFGECHFGLLPNAPDGINCDYQGRSNQMVPDYSGRLSLEYSKPLRSGLHFGFDLDVIFEGDYLLSSNLDPLQVQDAYQKLNARVTFGDYERRWELALIGKNLTDESIILSSGDTPLAGNNFGAHGFLAYFEAPRTFALQMTLQY